MAMDLKEIEELIKEAFPDATVDIQDLAGDGNHYSAEVISSQFNGKSKIVLHASKDSFIPLGVSATSTLPSRKSIVQKAIDLING